MSGIAILRDSYNEKKDYYYIGLYEESISEIFDSMQFALPGLIVELDIATSYAEQVFAILERDFNRVRVGFVNNTRRKSSWYNITLDALKEAIHTELPILMFEDMLKRMFKAIGKLDDEEKRDGAIDSMRDLLNQALNKLTRKEYVCLYLCIPEAELVNFERNDYLLDCQEQQQIVDMMHWFDITRHVKAEECLSQRFYCG